jgi:hypothetical protein
MRALMSARTTSGSMGGSRGGVELQATEKYGSRSQERQESRTAQFGALGRIGRQTPFLDRSPKIEC